MQILRKKVKDFSSSSPTTAAPSAEETLQQPSQAPTSEPALETTALQQALKDQILTQLNQISETSSRIKVLEAQLESEKENLSKDLITLRQTFAEQQKEVKSYFCNVTAEIKKLDAVLTDKEIMNNKNEQNRPNRRSRNSRSRKGKS